MGALARMADPNAIAFTKASNQADLFETVSLGAVKAFWDRKPCNSGWYFPGLEQGTREWFEAVEKRRYRVEPHSYEFGGFAEAEGKNVLEIGGGICTDSMSFVKNGANVTIVDLFGLNATIIQGSAMELDQFLPAMKFDVIYSY